MLYLAHLPEQPECLVRESKFDTIYRFSYCIFGQCATRTWATTLYYCSVPWWCFLCHSFPSLPPHSDHVGSALVPLLVFTAVPSAPVSSALSDELSDSPRYMMPSLAEDESVERSDSFYRPAMTPQEKEAFYRPIVRPSVRDGKKSNKVCIGSVTCPRTLYWHPRIFTSEAFIFFKNYLQAHVRCSSTDTVMEHSHGNRVSRPHRKKSSSRCKSESCKHACRHRRAKSEHPNDRNYQ